MYGELCLVVAPNAQAAEVVRAVRSKSTRLAHHPEDRIAMYVLAARHLEAALSEELDIAWICRLEIAGQSVPVGSRGPGGHERSA